MSLVAEVFTDGSCHTQKCIGAWAAIVFVNDQKIELSGIESDTTHNRMEILAVIKATEYIQENFHSVTEINVVSDSQYVVGLIARQTKFIAQNFNTKGGDPIRNIDLVKKLLELTGKLNFKFTKIKAHQKKSDEPNYNIDADKLCRSLVRDAVASNS